MENSKSSHFYWIDTLRFIAAFAVVMCHFRGAFFVDYVSLPVEQQNILTFVFYAMSRLGHESVMIFFVLSGFLVGGKSIEKIQNGTFDCKSYAIDRFVRIMLPLASVLFLYIPITLWRGAEIEWPNWFGCWFSLQNIFTDSCIEPLWSLSFEVWFYVLVPAVYLTLNKKKFGGVFLLFICVLVFTLFKIHYLSLWLMGAVAYMIRPLKRNNTMLFGSFFGLFAMIVILLYTNGGHVTTGWVKYLPTLNREIYDVWYALFACIFIQQIILIEPKNRFAKISNKLGGKLAAFSYTLYLGHVLVLRSLEHLGAPKSETICFESVLLWIAWMIITLLICYLLYLGFEKQTPVVKEWLKSRILK